ncbi:MAG: TIM barrel protein [Gammaproteobacteria bacterium]|nr:TIM barrel protein [Gammaproteobacteria bacterium]
MLRFAANLSTMFDETDELARLHRIERLGFKYLEWLFPYSCDKNAIAARLNELNLELVLINAALGSAKDGDRGIGALPGRVDEFKKAMTQAIEYAIALNVPMIHVMAGVCPESKDRSEYLETFASNLTWATDQLKGSSTQLLVEPLNQVDTPNYLIGTSAQAIELMDMTNANVGLQFDFYHLQIMEGNLGSSLKNHIDRIAHVQFSSLPGRHEPQFGEVNCKYLFDLLETLAYKGFIGCEYRPKTTVEEGLSWATPYGIGD